MSIVIRSITLVVAIVAGAAIGCLKLDLLPTLMWSGLAGGCLGFIGAVIDLKLR